MGDANRFVHAAVALSLALAVTACVPAPLDPLDRALLDYDYVPPPGASRMLGPGSTFTAKSGLSVTVPGGAIGSVAEPGPGQPTQFVDVRVDQTISVEFISWPSRNRNVLQRARKVASTPDGEVVVLERRSGSVTFTAVETNLPGSAPGRVLIVVARSRGESRHGLALARFVWDRLSVQGAALP